jgi:uncharacterized protein YjbI with pentapeptide repeats
MPCRRRDHPVMAFVDEHELSECERALWRAAGAGEPVDLSTSSARHDDPSGGAGWGPERTVRADLLYELLLSEPTPRAIVLRGARISGSLNLEAATLGCPLTLESCCFDGAINLRQARAETIRLTGCQLTCLEAAQLETRGNLDLRRTAASVIGVAGAHIGGQLMFSGASLSGGSWPPDLADATLSPFSDSTVEDRAEGIALVGDGLRVDGDMFCREGFAAAGEVRLRGAHIHGSLKFREASLTNAHGYALNAAMLKVDAGMSCREPFVATGEVSLVGAHIHGGLDLIGARLTNNYGSALSAGGLRVEGAGMFCSKGLATGGVSLVGAHIQGELNFDEARLTNASGSALNADGIQVDGSMFCREGFVATGEVRLVGARIHGVLDFDGARLFARLTRTADPAQAAIKPGLTPRPSPPNGEETQENHPAALPVKERAYAVTCSAVAKCPDLDFDHGLEVVVRGPEDPVSPSHL